MKLNEAVRPGRLEGVLSDHDIEAIARPYTMRELLDMYAEAERNRENEVAQKLRWLIDGRVALIESWSMGSSIVCAAINGRKVS